MKHPFLITMLFLLTFISCTESIDNHKYAFITSNTYEGFSLMGLDGANEKCSKEALDNELISNEEYNQRKYKAWLSFNGIDAKNIINKDYDYYTVNGNYIGSYDDIINSNLNNPINVESNGIQEEQYSYVWTGTTYNGEYFINGDCLGWNEFKSNAFAIIGKSNQINIEWTHIQNIKAECISFYKLYCFEQ